jgi:hypothetical protein
MLGEEALASIKGYRMMKAMGQNPRLSRYAWPLATYTSAAALNAGLPAYLAYKQHHNNVLKEEAEMGKHGSLSKAYDAGITAAYTDLQKFAAATMGF